jgi:hypothetical protein
MNATTIDKDATIADMLHAIITVYANAAESPEWIRMRLAPIIQQAIQEENERITARLELYPDAVYGGDGPWNNYGD